MLFGFRNHIVENGTKWDPMGPNKAKMKPIGSLGLIETKWVRMGQNLTKRDKME